jgi:hypothetical protein
MEPRRFFHPYLTKRENVRSVDRDGDALGQVEINTCTRSSHDTRPCYLLALIKSCNSEEACRRPG